LSPGSWQFLNHIRPFAFIALSPVIGADTHSAHNSKTGEAGIPANLFCKGNEDFSIITVLPFFRLGIFSYRDKTPVYMEFPQECSIIKLTPIYPGRKTEPGKTD
jgi:hypothetical protein